MLQNLQIRSKLALVLILPLAMLVILAGARINQDVTLNAEAGRIDELTQFVVGISALTHELQRERDYTAQYIGSGYEVGYGSLVSQRVQVNSALTAFHATRAEFDLDDQPAAVRGRLNELVPLLSRKKVDEIRAGVEDEKLSIEDAVTGYYTEVIDSLISVGAQVSQISSDRDLIRDATTFVDMGRAKDNASHVRWNVAAALTSPEPGAASPISPAEMQEYISAKGAEDTWLAQARTSATAEQSTYLRKQLSGRDFERVDGLNQLILDPDPKVPEAREWFLLTTAKIDAMRDAELKLASDLVDTAQAASARADRQAVTDMVGTAAVLAVTILLSLLIARSMARPLRRLQETANEVADRRLPGMVERLQAGEAVDMERLRQETAPIVIRSRDEIGQVADAFNSVHRVAVRVATEQAALRKSIGDMFLNLARRSQTLIDRQLELIDDLERNEADPDALEHLFRLDHLATRMRRNAEDLIVLSGAEPARRWSQPVALVDVVRAALAEIEDYNRVELLPIDDLGVVGQAVSDVVHLLAELIENATAFSPPGTKVQIAGQPVSNGYVLEIEDRGLGMSDEELVEANERLANPPEIDFALSRMLGLYVVGRLAQRYDIKVQLRHSWYGGVTALVLLPPNLTVRVPATPAVEPAVTPQRAELAAPPGGNHAPNHTGNHGLPAAPQAESQAQSIEHLPIFEAARSDWFETGTSTPHLPLRRHASSTYHLPEPDAPQPPLREPAPPPRPAAASPGSQAPPPPPPASPPWERREPVGSSTEEIPVQEAPAAGQRFPTGEQPAYQPPQQEAPRPAPRPEPPGRPDVPLPQRVAPPIPRPGAPDGRMPPHPFPAPGATPGPVPAPPPSRPPEPAPASAAGGNGPGWQVTKAGLPRRVPRQSMAPGLSTPAESPPPTPSQPPPAPSGIGRTFGRSPAEVRSMLSSYRSGLERGRMTATGGPDRSGPSAPRSDDDPAQ